MVYEPHEDSFLMQKNLYPFVHGRVLDIGTGMGILAQEAAKYANQVLAVDIDSKVLAYAQKQCCSLSNITFCQSDLFSNVKGTFDVILFNPPYLPTDYRAPDVALDGGKKGYEIIERFLNAVSCYLKPEGVILLVFSSLTKKAKIDEILKENLFEAELIEAQKFSFEELYLYRISKSAVLKKLEDKGITQVHFMAKGHRGCVYSAVFKRTNKPVVVKVKNPKATIDKLWNEIKFLKLFQKYSFAPKLYEVYSINYDFVVMEFVDGKPILDFFTTANKQDILNVVKKIFEIAMTLDTLKINKEEMHHPMKHIIITKKLRVVFIDFERCRYTEKPKNVTQFCQFLCHGSVRELLAKKGLTVDKEKILDAAKRYKVGGTFTFTSLFK